MRVAGLTILFLLTAACATTAPPLAPDSESCAARAEPTALKMGPGSGITPPKAIYRAEPHIPLTLRGRDAVATVEAIIGEDGKARHICLAKGDPEWGHVVEVALREWLFEPATLEGRPVAVRFTLTTRLSR